LSFFEKVRGEYLRRAKADPERFVIIDALKTPDATWQQLQEISFNY
jgi:dTMP kinase